MRRISKAEIQEHFDTLFERDGLLTDPAPMPEERITVLEEELRAAKILLGVDA